MISIDKFYLPKMLNGETVAFHTDSPSGLEQAEVSKRFPEGMATYRAGVTNLKRTYDVTAASELSIATQNLDSKLGKLWSSFKAYLKVCLNSEGSSETDTAAERVMLIIRSGQ